jgi:peptidoglycan biosynthesis protein MviN/MurJ (putative lipid II flippase)
VILNLIGLLIAVGGGYLLAPKFDILSIPIAFATASLVELVLLIALLPSRLKKLPSRPSGEARSKGAASPQIDLELDPNQS